MSQPPPPPSPAPGQPDRRALIEAFQDVVRAEQERSSPSVPAPGTPVRHGARALLFLTAAALLAILVTKPEWLFPRPPVEPPELVDASLRVRMYVEIGRIERFRADSGHLPASLTDAGVDTTGLTYAAEPDGYSLTGRNRGTSLTFRSGGDPKLFLGDSYKLVSDRRKAS